MNQNKIQHPNGDKTSEIIGLLKLKRISFN